MIPVDNVQLISHPISKEHRLVRIEGYTTVVRADEFSDGDKAWFYPYGTEMQDGTHIMGKRIENVLSHGLLIKNNGQPTPEWRTDPYDGYLDNEEEYTTTNLPAPFINGDFPELREGNMPYNLGERLTITEWSDGIPFVALLEGASPYIYAQNHWRKITGRWGNVAVARRPEWEKAVNLMRSFNCYITGILVGDLPRKPGYKGSSHGFRGGAGCFLFTDMLYKNPSDGVLTQNPIEYLSSSGLPTPRILSWDMPWNPEVTMSMADGRPHSTDPSRNRKGIMVYNFPSQGKRATTKTIGDNWLLSQIE